MKKPRISVIMITYNQEDVISRTIDSLINQGDSLYEICVSDDCSTDRTWEILTDYSELHPGLFKLHRNEVNLGIFANEEQTWGLPTGDIVYRIAGDDLCCDGYFDKVIDFINAAGIDWEHELFCIIGNNIIEDPEGRRYEISNRILQKGHSALKLKLRALLNDRSACFSRKVLEKYIPVSKGRSHVVEEAQDDQLEIFSEKFYYVDAPGNVYYSGQGISSRLSTEILEERTQIFSFFERFVSSLGIELDRPDKSYVKFMTSYLNYGSNKRLRDLLKSIFFFFGSIDLSLREHSINFKFIFAALIRKIRK